MCFYQLFTFPKDVSSINANTTLAIDSADPAF
jgi:hypothetical protein